MEIPVPIRRLTYRLGYRILQAVWLITRPTLRGVKCLLTDGNRVLLVRHTYGRRWWDLPGGAIARGECPQRAARREMHEELGLDDVAWSPGGELQVRTRRRTDRMYLFRAELTRPPIKLDPGELQDARWFDRGELPVDLAPLAQAIIERAPAGSSG